MIEGFLTKSWMGLEVGTEVCLDEERQVLNVPNAPHPSFNKSLQGCTMVLIPGDYENLKEIIKTVYFISGHLDLTEEEFITHYIPKIDAALQSKQNIAFVVGDARGCDSRAQKYLLNFPWLVTVYHMFESPRNNIGNFNKIKIAIAIFRRAFLIVFIMLINGH